MNDFLRAAMKVQEQYNLRHQNNSAQQSSPVQQDGTIFVKTDYRVVRIAIADIRYVEGMSEYLKIHLEGQKPVITLLAMKKIEDYLPQSQFMRIHRSYIVNLSKIQEVNKNRVILDAETYLPLGDMYKEKFNDYLSRNFLGK
jgi:DNA-binding LytR/AlgR family response regulator